MEPGPYTWEKVSIEPKYPMTNSAPDSISARSLGSTASVVGVAEEIEMLDDFHVAFRGPMPGGSGGSHDTDQMVIAQDGGRLNMRRAGRTTSAVLVLPPMPPSRLRRESHDWCGCDGSPVRPR